MSSIYKKDGRLYFSVKVDGKWKGIRTEFVVGQERAAAAMLRRLEVSATSGGQVVAGPLTVTSFSTSWLKTRKTQVITWKNDETALRLHALPAIGHLRIDEVRPHHIVAMIKAWRAKGMAPRSVYNDYSTVCAMFRDAALDEFLPTTPCILTKRQLGPKHDKDPEWRRGALFSHSELATLISDTRVSMDRRVFYALEGLAGLRLGEVSGLHWRNCGAQPELPPLGMLYVAFSHERPMPKGDVCRPVPIHPVLATILDDWRAFGWEQMMGRKPTADDLVVPLPPQAKCAFGRSRRKGYVFDRFEDDLKTLGLRHRRSHDLRRTFISLARSAVAMTDVLKRATHKPPTEVIEGYTTYEWDVVCREVLKLKIEFPRPSPIAVFSRASQTAAMRVSTALSTEPDQPFNIAPVTTVALPGLEPGCP